MMDDIHNIENVDTCFQQGAKIQILRFWYWLTSCTEFAITWSQTNWIFKVWVFPQMCHPAQPRGCRGYSQESGMSAIVMPEVVSLFLYHVFSAQLINNGIFFYAFRRTTTLEVTRWQDGLWFKLTVNHVHHSLYVFPILFCSILLVPNR